MRTKTIILGAIVALALATLSANAGNRATHQAQGSLVSLVAASTTVAKADREAAATEPVVKTAVAAKPAAKGAVSAACQDAISNLKALRQAGVADKPQWRAALLAARTACLPQRSAACQAAIAALQALKANSVGDWRNLGEPHQLSDLRNVNWPAQLASLRSAVAVVATACGERD